MALMRQSELMKASVTVMVELKECQMASLKEKKRVTAAMMVRVILREILTERLLVPPFSLHMLRCRVRRDRKLGIAW